MTLLLLLGVSLVVFVILYLSPGNPFKQIMAGSAGAMFGAQAHRSDLPALRSRLQQDGLAMELEGGYLDAMTGIEPLQQPRW